MYNVYLQSIGVLHFLVSNYFERYCKAFEIKHKKKIRKCKHIHKIADFLKIYWGARTRSGYLNGFSEPWNKTTTTLNRILNHAVLKIKPIPYIHFFFWHDASLLSALFDAFIGFHCYFILIFWFNVRHELIIFTLMS